LGGCDLEGLLGAEDGGFGDAGEVGVVGDGAGDGGFELADGEWAVAEGFDEDFAGKDGRLGEFVIAAEFFGDEFVEEGVVVIGGDCGLRIADCGLRGEI
jgi:hypothetical protein